MDAPDGFESVVALIGALQTRHGAIVRAHDVDADGAVTFDLTLSPHAVRSLRAAYRRELLSRNQFLVQVTRDWTAQVWAHTEAVRRIVEPA
jgi:hypothetical protein